MGWEPPDPGEFDALLIGSANAIRHGGDGLKQFRKLPAHVVGKTTEKEARKFGLRIASVGSGGLQDVLDRIEPPKSLLRIAGADHVELKPGEGITIKTVMAYESVPLPLDPALAKLLGGEDCGREIVLLHSASAARHFAAECERLGIERSGIEIAALGPRIASAAGKEWRAIHVSKRPTDADLLALASSLCQ